MIYVWAAKTHPLIGIRQGDHILVREVKDAAGNVRFIYEDWRGELWELRIDDVIESRIEGFLAGDGPVTFAAVIVACFVIYMAWQIARWV